MKRRIFNSNRHTPGIKPGQSFRIAVKASDVDQKILQAIGFSIPLTEGQVILPSSTFGKTSMFNAEGKEIIVKGQPFETRYRQALWTWEQWIGRGQTETHSKIVDIPYKRRPRKFVAPPGVELLVLRSSDGDFQIVSPILTKNDADNEGVTHVINLFLEIFGDFNVLDTNGIPILKTEIRHLNWQILPEGKYPWEKTKEIVKNILENTSKGKRQVIEDRIQEISSYTPNFIAKGMAGFHGYLVFGFEGHNLFILENALYGNAIYVFDHDWEALSKLTKADILTGKLQRERIIHGKGWKENLKAILNLK